MHQDYKGKRVFVNLLDGFNNSFEAKLDIRVHKNFELPVNYVVTNILNFFKLLEFIEV